MHPTHHVQEPSVLHEGLAAALLRARESRVFEEDGSAQDFKEKLAEAVKERSHGD